MTTCQHKKNFTQCVFLQCICYHSQCFSAEKYSSPNRRCFASPSSLLSSLSLLDRWRQLSLLPRLKITIFSQNITVNVKLIHTSGLGVCFFPIWSRRQISWRRLATKDAGVISDRTTCRAKIVERGVIRNTWIRGKKATFLDDGQIWLAAVSYSKIIDCWLLGRPIQVNGAFYSIKKSRAITTNSLPWAAEGAAKQR